MIGSCTFRRKECAFFQESYVVSTLSRSHLFGQRLLYFRGAVNSVSFIYFRGKPVIILHYSRALRTLLGLVLKVDHISECYFNHLY